MLTVGMYLSDRYEIVGKIGAGGMSDVYKAADHSLGRNVAIKVLKQEFSEDINFVTKFRTEAQSAAKLEHPNIVNIYDVGSESGMHYIVMEYVEGITLKTYIEKKHQLSFKEAVSISIQVARGIEAAHNKGIIHRDIKPQNIIISTEGKVKVTDFGIARAASSNTISSDVMGSVHYASPEQARNGFVDGRSDIYSLGIMMYEMVTGRVPFDGDTTVAVAIQHLQEEMVSPSAYASELPISMEKIILKCTQKNPDRRYQNIADVLMDLRKSLISPNEDFVVMIEPLEQGKTRVISEAELKQIREEAGEDEEENAFYDEDADEDDEYDEDEDDGKGLLNPKMDKAVTIMGIVAAIVIVIVIVLLIGSIAGVFKFGKKKPSVEPTSQVTEASEIKASTEEEVEMIDVTGMDEEAAKTALDKLGLSIFVASYKESDKYEDGQIIEQDPKKGSKIAKGSTVKVILAGAADGSKKITVPDVKGKDEGTAVSEIKDAKLNAEKNYQYDANVPSGQVISQSPAAGSSAKEKDTIKIVISKGNKPSTVPNVVGADKNNAVNALTNAGLNANVVEEEDNNNVGKVIRQDYAANKEVPAGTTVTITVGKAAAAKEYTASYNFQVPNNAAKMDITFVESNGSVITPTENVTLNGNTYSYTASKKVTSKDCKFKVTFYDAEGNAIEEKEYTPTFK